MAGSRCLVKSSRQGRGAIHRARPGLRARIALSSPTGSVAMVTAQLLISTPGGRSGAAKAAAARCSRASAAPADRA